MKLTLKEKRHETADATTFIFEPAEPLHWQPGQFLHYKLPHEPMDDRNDERWFTIASAPFEHHVRITTRHADKSSSFKTALFNLEAGDTIEADGPEGDFVVTDPNEEFVFIAGGIGITPYRAILADLDNKGIPIKGRLLYANRDDNFVYKDELEKLASKHPGFTIHYFTGDERIDADALRTLVPDLGAPVFYVSGPEPMVEALEKMLLGMKIADDRIKRDYFPGYVWP